MDLKYFGIINIFNHLSCNIAISSSITYQYFCHSIKFEYDFFIYISFLGNFNDTKAIVEYIQVCIS